MSISTIIFIIVFVVFIIRKLGAKQEIVAEVPPIVHQPKPFMAEKKVKQPQARSLKTPKSTSLQNTTFSEMSAISEKKVPFDERNEQVLEIITENEFALQHEDLRKAIIYSEIINRKY
jgi:hypothetical protein